MTVIGGADRPRHRWTAGQRSHLQVAGPDGLSEGPRSRSPSPLSDASAGGALHNGA